MDFYTLAYVESQAVIGQTWGFIIIVAVLLALLILGVQVLRNGFTSRYRDLMIILSLIVVFFLGLEYQEYNRMKPILRTPLVWLNFYILLVQIVPYRATNWRLTP